MRSPLRRRTIQRDVLVALLAIRAVAAQQVRVAAEGDAPVGGDEGRIGERRLTHSGPSVLSEALRPSFTSQKVKVPGARGALADRREVVGGVVVVVDVVVVLFLVVLVVLVVRAASTSVERVGMDAAIGRSGAMGQGNFSSPSARGRVR